MALLDEWVAPEPSPYFDTRLHARLREEAAKQPSSWFSWINLRRPVLAASLVAVVAIGASVFRLEEKKLHHPTPTVASVAEPGTAVGDLQALDQNHDVYADSDLLDDLQVQQDVNANP
jgi:anti-sigma-K factor RskA